MASVTIQRVRDGALGVAAGPCLASSCSSLFVPDCPAFQGLCWFVRGLPTNQCSSLSLSLCGNDRAIKLPVMLHSGRSL